MKRRYLSRTVFLCALLFAHAPRAAEIAGVLIPDQANLDGSDRPLPLNGAGVREKFFMDIYVGALYLETKTNDAATAIDSPGPKRVLMHFVYSEVSREKLADAWQEGFASNSDQQSLPALKPRIDQFAELFQDAKEGDVYALDFLPGEGTRVSLNGTRLGTIEGEDFNRALLSVWLGDNPVTKKLKRAMLGAD